MRQGWRGGFVVGGAVRPGRDGGQRPDGLRTLAMRRSAVLSGSAGRWLVVVLPGRGLGLGALRLPVVVLSDLVVMVASGPTGCACWRCAGLRCWPVAGCCSARSRPWPWSAAPAGGGAVRLGRNGGQRPDWLRSLATVAPAAAWGGDAGRWLPGRGLGPGARSGRNPALRSNGPTGDQVELNRAAGLRLEKGGSETQTGEQIRAQNDYLKTRSEVICGLRRVV